MKKASHGRLLFFWKCHFIFDSWMDLFIKQTLQGANFVKNNNFYFLSFGLI